MSPCPQQAVVEMFDHADYMKSLEAEAREKRRLSAANLQEIVRAEPDMKILTGRQEWDKLLSYLQAVKISCETQLKAAEDRVLSPSLWKNEDIVSAKMDVIRLRERIGVLDLVMTLPKEIIGVGEVAKEKLDELNGRNRWDDAT